MPSEWPVTPTGEPIWKPRDDDPEPEVGDRVVVRGEVIREAEGETFLIETDEHQIIEVPREVCRHE